MRSQGRVAWRRFNEAVRGGRIPAREVADGVLVIFGGALLLTPGFITDILGALFLLPPTRALIRRLFLRRATSRITVSMAGPAMRAARLPPRRRRRGHRGRRRPASAAPAPGPRGVTARRRDAARRRVGQRHVRVRRRRRGGLRPRPPGLARAPGGARRGSALALLFSGREPVAALAVGDLELADGAGWDALAPRGVATTTEAPLDRWTIAFDAADGQGFALPSRRSEGPPRSPATRCGSAGWTGTTSRAAWRARSAPAAASSRSTRSGSAGRPGAIPTGSGSSSRAP